MSELTPRMSWPFPSEFQDPWYDAFVSLLQAIDASAYAAREDRNMIMMGGGSITLNSTTGLLSWSAPFNLFSGPTGLIWVIPAGSVTIADGQMFSCQVTRNPQGNITQTLTVAAKVPNDDNSVVIGVRQGGVVYFRNGTNTASSGADVDSWNVTAIKTVGASYNAVANDFVRANGSGGALTIVLPTAIGISGQQVAVKDVGGGNTSGNINIATTGGQTIDGSASAVLGTLVPGNLAEATFVSDGANWSINGHWKPSTGGTTTLQQAYVAGNVINLHNFGGELGFSGVYIMADPGGASTDLLSIYDRISNLIFGVNDTGTGGIVSIKHLDLFGRHILSTGGNTGDVWTYDDGTSTWSPQPLPSGVSAESVWFSTADWAQAKVVAGNLGDYTNGARFYMNKNATILGARWWQPSGMTTNVKVSLWDQTTTTRLATVTITPTAGAINTATFGSPYAYTANAHELSIVVYDGVHQILYTGGAFGPLDTPSLGTQTGHVWGIALAYLGNGYQAGDNKLANYAATYPGIEPVYTIP